MRNLVLIVLGIIIIPILMVLITPFALPILFIVGAYTAVSLILDIIQGILTKSLTKNY